MDTLEDARIRAVTRANVGGEKRIEILDAAIAVIVRRGFDNTRYIDIAEASGVAVSTLQYYFGSLESLLIETCLYASHRDLEVVRERVAALDQPWDRLVYLIDVFLTSEAPGPGWQAQIEYWRAAFTRPHLREELIRDQNTWRALITDALREGIDRGQFHVDRDVELIAMQINCQCDGTVFPAFARNPAYDAAAYRAATIEDIARLLEYNPGNP